MEGALKPQAGQQRKPWSIQNTPAGWVPTRLTPQPGQGVEPSGGAAACTSPLPNLSTLSTPRNRPSY